MTKEKLAKLRGMGLVFDGVFDDLAELKERRRLANELAIVFDDAPDSVQNENQLLYHTYYSKDGVALIQKYLNDGIIKERGSFEDDKTDINIYYEDGSNEDAFGSICYVRMNYHLRKSFGNREFGITVARLAEAIILKEKDLKAKAAGYVVMNQELLEESIHYELRPNNAAANLLVELLTKFFKQLAKNCRDSFYTEKNWNPFLKDYDPIFGFVNYKKVVESWNAYKIKSNQRISKARYLGRLLYKYIPVIGEILQSIIEKMVDIYKAIINGIDYYIERIEYRLDQIAIINAFVCGINNGVGDFVAGLFDLCALLVTIIDKVERDSITEKLENLYEDFKKHPLDKIQKTLVDAFNDLIERYTNKSEFENAYHKGEDLVSLFILVDGVLEVVKVLKGIPKGFEELAAWAERSAKRLGGVVKSVEELTEFVIKNGIQIDKKGLEFVIVMVKGDRGLIESILLSTKEVIEGKTIEELVAFFKIIDPPKVGSLSNYQARIWYTLKKQKIGALIERESSLLAKAKKAFNLRNEFRAATRNFMKDKKLAGYLESVEKNMKWEEIMERTLKKEKINSIEDAYNYIITTSKKGRDGVDKLFKID